MLTLSVKTSRDHPLPPPSPLRSPVSSFLLSCQIKFDRHDLTGQVKPDGTLVGSCILNWNGVGVQVLRNDYLLVVEEDWNAQLVFRVGGKWMHCFSRFQYCSYIVVVSFIRGGNGSTRTVLSQVSDKLCHLMLYREYLDWAGFELTFFVFVGTDCVGSCKSNYHTITITTYIWNLN